MQVSRQQEITRSLKIARKWRKKGAKGSVGLSEGRFEGHEAHLGVNYSRSHVALGKFNSVSLTDCPQVKHPTAVLVSKDSPRSKSSIVRSQLFLPVTLERCTIARLYTNAHHSGA